MGKSQEGDVHPLGIFGVVIGLLEAVLSGIFCALQMHIKRRSAARQTAWAAPVSRVEKNPDKQYTV
jgi:hypothetical protein